MNLGQKQDAYADGYKAGRADYLLARTSDLARADLDAPNSTYRHWYAVGYRAAQNAGSLLGAHNI